MYRTRIYYPDTDAGGVVYYGNYLRYFEAGRTEYLRERGVDLAALMEAGILFVVVRVEIDYRAPARYGDEVLVESRCTSMGRVRLVMENRAVRAGDGRTLAEGRTTLACVDRDGRPVPLPPEVRRSLGEAP